MFLQDGPADTLNYMILGFSVILGAMGLFILGLWIRFRNARRDLAALAEVESPPRA